MERVKSIFLDKNINVNKHYGKNLDTPLHLAGRNRNFEISRMLLRKGAKVDALNKSSLTPLHIALKQDNTKIFNLLMIYGADIHRKSKENRSYLHIAASYGHMNLCKILFESYKLDITSTDNSGWTVIHCAAESGNIKLFQYFIQQGSSVYSKTKDNKNCLHISVSKGYLNLSKKLFESYNFDIKVTNSEGWNVLHYAAKSGNLDLFKYFVQNGCDVTSKTKQSTTSLHVAGKGGHLNLCKALLESFNFDIHTTDDEGYNVLHYAAESGNLELLYYIREHWNNVYRKTKDNPNSLNNLVQKRHVKLKHKFDAYPQNNFKENVSHLVLINSYSEFFKNETEYNSYFHSKTKNGRNPLHIAASKGYCLVSKALLEIFNIEIHIRDFNGHTFLLCAAESGNLELFNYFIERGCDIFSKTKDNKNSLHLAAYNGHFKLCKALLQYYSFDIRLRDDEGWTALHCAAKIGDLELFQYFIEEGSDIYSKTKDGKSCLHLAAENRHFEICRELLENHSFDIHTRDDHGINVLHCAAKSGDLELLQYLIDNGSDTFSKTKAGCNCLHIAAQKGHLKICRELLQNHNFDIHAKDNYWLTSLHRAALGGDLEILQYFIENGSDIFSKTKDGHNCLHLAAQNGNLKICRAFLQNYNFDIHARDDFGWTVLHRAALSGDLELFQYLIENEADIFSKTKSGQTCLQKAADKGHLNICKLLLQNYNFDIHARDDYGWTALHSAAMSGNLELLQYFIGNGSDIFGKVTAGQSCFHIAAEEGHLKICRALLQNYNFDIHTKDDYGWTVLHRAALGGDLELLQYLIENGSDIFSKTKCGRSCLHIAAAKGHLKICRALLRNYKFDIHARDDYGCTVLHQAGLSGDLELFQLLIGNGSDIYSKTKDGQSCLQKAVEKGHLKLCRAILENYNFDINARDDYGWTELNYAAFSGDLEFLQYLIEIGSDIFSKTKSGKSCLHIAAERGHLEMCRVLLQNYNFDINARDDYGWTELHCAAFSGELELLQYLIENGSDIFSKTKVGKSCLHIAAENRYFKICRVLLENHHFDIHARDDYGWNVLHCAAFSGDLELLQYLIENGSEIFSKTKVGRSCLDITAEKGHLQICKALLQNFNFDIHGRDDNGWTSLHYAALSGDLELLQYLIENGSDIFSKTKAGCNCLHVAAQNGHLKICRELLQNHNVDIHSRDDDGWTSLHRAALGGDFEILQYFTENGSDIFSKTKDGHNCLHLAAQNGNLKICRTFLQNYSFDIHARDGFGWTVLHRATLSGDLELFQYLIEYGSDVFSKTKSGKSCLHIAAERGHLEMCRVLLQNYNFTINARDDYGCTVLHWAAFSGELELLQYLIENGSDIFSKTKNGQNCLHVTAKEGHLKICKALLQNYNFDIHARDDNGWTVLHCASLSGDLAVLQYLVENGSDIFSKTKTGENCLQKAAEKGHLKICRALLQNYNFDIHARDDIEWNVLHNAAWSGDVELFQYFIQSGSDIFSKTKDDKTVLHLAANNGYLKMCMSLLQNYNFDITSRDDDGWTVLHYASGSGNLELFKCLIEKGSEVGSKTKDHTNCLHIAAWNGHLDICKVLLEKYSFDVHETNEEGFNALLCATEFGDLEMYQYFTENWNCVSSKTKDGRHLLHIAASKGRFNLIKSILKYHVTEIETKCNKGWNILHYSAQSGNLELFEYLLENGSAIHEKTKNKCNCLHIAASNGHLNLCKKLLEKHNFNIALTDAKGWNALHYAAKSGNSELFGLFIQKGSDVYSKTNINSNCLHITASNGRLKLFKTLVEAYKFDIFMKDDRGWTVLNKAARGGDLELFRYLIQLGADIYSRTKDNVTCLHIASHHGHLKLCQTILDLYYSDLEKWTCNEFENFDKCNAIYRRRLFKTKNAFLNLRDLGGFTYLHYASSQGHADICKFLLMHNVDVTYRNEQGKTARDIAIKRKQLKVLDVLKDKYDPLGK